jgi:hypothetical protein
MKIGEIVIATKGTKKGDTGQILGLEGTGASRKWSIRWSDGQISSHHAKSLQIYESDQSSESNIDSDEESEADDVIESESDSDSDSESSSISYSDAFDGGILAQL